MLTSILGCNSSCRYELTALLTTHVCRKTASDTSHLFQSAIPSQIDPNDRSQPWIVGIPSVHVHRSVQTEVVEKQPVINLKKYCKNYN